MRAVKPPRGEFSLPERKWRDYVTRALPEVGTVILNAASGAQHGYFLCDGSAVSRTRYAELFAKIGTTYGVGDGSTTFNVPNLTAVSGVNYVIKF